MIATMYKRRMKAAFALSSIVMLIGISVFFIDRPDSLQNWLNLSSIGKKQKRPTISKFSLPSLKLRQLKLRGVLLCSFFVLLLHLKEMQSNLQ